VSAQIGNAVSAVTALLDAGKTLTDSALVNGALTAVQGIVSAPVTATLAGETGVTSALVTTASETLRRVARGVNAVVASWLGNGSTPGALQHALATVGTSPLSPASYTNAVSIVVGRRSNHTGYGDRHGKLICVHAVPRSSRSHWHRRSGGQLIRLWNGHCRRRIAASR
jgi:hypothetical protein